MLVDHARPERLRELVLGLLHDHPDLWVSADVEDIVRVPEGTVMVLEPQAKDADFLNLNRPVFARRQLKVVLWCDTETTKALATRAVDFFDWISHRHECPPGAALHGVLGLRAAAQANLPVIGWTGGDLEACFREAFPGEEFVRLSATRPYSELVDAVKAAGDRWIVFGEIEHNRHRVAIILQVLAAANRTTRVVLEDYHRYLIAGFHGKLMHLTDACAVLQVVPAPKRGLFAALAGLEPEAMQILRTVFLKKKGTRILRKKNTRVQRKKDTSEIEGVLRNASDPGAALAKIIPPKFSESVLPPNVRAFAMEEQTLTHRVVRGLENMLTDSNEMLVHGCDGAQSAAIDGQYTEALSLAESGVELAVQLHGEISPWHIKALTILAGVLAQRGQLKKSEATFHKAFDLVTRCGSRCFGSFELFDGWADVLSRLGRYDEAEETAEYGVEAAKASGLSMQLHYAEDRLQKIRALRQQSS